MVGLIRWMVVGVNGGILKVFAPFFGFVTMQADISPAHCLQKTTLARSVEWRGPEGSITVAIHNQTSTTKTGDVL